MVISQQRFQVQANVFFWNLNYLVQDVKTQFPETNENLDNWIESGFTLLLNTYGEPFYAAIGEMLRLQQEEDGTLDRPDAYDLLYRELKYFNSRFNYIGIIGEELPIYQPWPFPEIHIPDRIKKIPSKEKIESGQVVLDSVKELFKKLPAWMQKILTVVGEILGISKALLGG